jgi:hypothetical protein
MTDSRPLVFETPSAGSIAAAWVIRLSALCLGSIACLGLVSCRPSDATIERRIRERMMSYRQLKSANISVTASDGQVTLKGEVTSFDALMEALQIASSDPGQTRIFNKVTVLAASPPQTPVQPPTNQPQDGESLIASLAGATFYNGTLWAQIHDRTVTLYEEITPPFSVLNDSEYDKWQRQGAPPHWRVEPTDAYQIEGTGFQNYDKTHDCVVEGTITANSITINYKWPIGVRSDVYHRQARMPDIVGRATR